LRSRSPETFAMLTASVAKFGILSPPLITAANEVIVGRARIEAARRLGMRRVPVIRVHHLSADEVRAFRIADNKLVERAAWTSELALELRDLSLQPINLDLTAFTTSEIDLQINGLNEEVDAASEELESTDRLYRGAHAGDVWVLGRHRLLCGNCLKTHTYLAIMEGEQGRMVLTDPPYNLKIEGHVSGLGRHHHPEFAMASGEMTSDQFTDFLHGFLALVQPILIDGGLAYVFMDWRHTYELSMAQRRLGLQLLNICTWAKNNGGMGSFYRGATEFCFVMKHGAAVHVNNILLGKYGRYRTTLWSYPGANTFRKGRDEDLAAHPTVKPVSLFADAILDASKRDEIVLDPFGGSGTTLLAAERTGRRARVVEIDPNYVGVAIARWQKMTGQTAILQSTGESFAEVAARRLRAPGLPAVRRRTRTTPVRPSTGG
jgi:DNA modification methylase